MIEKIYIASSQALMATCEHLAEDLEQKFGVTITRKWWEHYVRDKPDFMELTDREFYSHPQVQFIREMDFKAVTDADLVIIISHLDYKPTGSLIECGYALRSGIPVIIWGEIKRSSMLSSCIHITGDSKELLDIIAKDFPMEKE